MLKPHDMICDRLVQSQIWTEEDGRELDKILPNKWTNASNKIGAFFNHHVADNASTFLDGPGRLHEEEQSLIPSDVHFSRVIYQ